MTARCSRFSRSTNGGCSRPVKHGDTLHLEATVLEKKESSKPDRGVVKFRRRFMKHDGTAVQEMETTLLYQAAPDAAA